MYDFGKKKNDLFSIFNFLHRITLKKKSARHGSTQNLLKNAFLRSFFAFEVSKWSRNTLEHTILHQNDTFSGKQFQQKCSVFQLMTYKLAEGGSNGGLNFLPGKQFSLRYETLWLSATLVWQPKWRCYCTLKLFNTNIQYGGCFLVP